MVDINKNLSPSWEGMVDIETLGNRNSTVVLEIGMAAFKQESPFINEDPGAQKKVRLDIQPQIENGRTIDQGTLFWWLEQDPDVISEVLSSRGRVPVEKGLGQFNNWISTHRIETIWCKGPSFDAAIISSLARDFGVELEIDYWNWRDVRTVKDLTNTEDIEPETAHDSVSDCVAQAKTVIKGRHKING